MAAPNSSDKEKDKEDKNRSHQKWMPVKIAFIVLCCAAVLVVLFLTNKGADNTVNAKKSKGKDEAKRVIGKASSFKRVPGQKPLTAESTVQEIIAYSESFKDRWKSIYAEGYTEFDGKKRYFKVAVQKPDKYWLEDGPSIMVSNGKKQWQVMSDVKRVTVSEIPEMPPEEKARLEKVMAEARKSDPTVSEPGEQIVPAPINDIINPSYIARKELRYNAKSVEKIDVGEVAGRKAILIMATFDKVKEDHWDIYVDAETGIFLGRVIVPLNDKENGESTFIDKLYIDQQIDQSRFDYQVPKGYRIESPPTRKKGLNG